MKTYVKKENNPYIKVKTKQRAGGVLHINNEVLVSRIYQELKSKLGKEN